MDRSHDEVTVTLTFDLEIENATTEFNICVESDLSDHESKTEQLRPSMTKAELLHPGIKENT